MSLKKLILVGLFVLLGTGIASADVIVRPGDTLSYIALDQTGRAKNWKELTAINPKTGDVRDPNMIFPGDIVVIPEELVIARAARTDTAKSGKVSSLAKVEKTKATVVGDSMSDRVVDPTEFASSLTEEPELTVETVSRKVAPVTAPVDHKKDSSLPDQSPLTASLPAELILFIFALILATQYKFFLGGWSYARATAHGARSRQWRVRKKFSGEKIKNAWNTLKTSIRARSPCKDVPAKKMTAEERESTLIELRSFEGNFKKVFGDTFCDSHIGPTTFQSEYLPEKEILRLKIMLDHTNRWRDLGDTIRYILNEKMGTPGFALRKEPWLESKHTVIEFKKREREDWSL